MPNTASTPWLHRWFRPLLGAIALLGLGLTGYLSWIKLTGQTLLCPSSGEGCQAVLNSPYATVFGVPLSVLGMAAYGVVAIATIVSQLVPALKSWTDPPLLWLTLGMATVSTYLMGVLIWDLHLFCPYCLASAIFSATLLILVLFGRTWDDLGQLISTTVIVVLITLVATLGIFAQQTPPVVASDGRMAIPTLKSRPKPKSGWEIITQSGPAEMALAEHLSRQGFKMYGAYWCPHCSEQKLLLGKQAFAKINYVECGKDGKNAQPEQCQAAGIQSFPTWELDGELYSGIQSPEALATLSDYEGNTTFKYFMPGL
ncbi:MAG: vitamin K epoxide reductase family protein [Spirulina sp. SIO3F2]|nr:vitamin K epoxide reductase family protein [Spirulina sp. SIO3F2]